MNFEKINKAEEKEDARKPANPFINEEMFLQQLDPEDYKMVKQHGNLFDEMDQAETGDDRRALWNDWKSEVSRKEFDDLREIAERLKSENRFNK
ncbi:MAG: hypothetical protein WD335_02830 [Candidatus Paceibacterota bacterium]